MRRGYRKPPFRRPFNRRPSAPKYSSDLDVEDNILKTPFEGEFSSRSIEATSKLELRYQNDCPYLCWPNYFPTIRYQNNGLSKLVINIIDFIENECSKTIEYYSLSDIATVLLHVDFESFIESSLLSSFNIKSLFLLDKDSEDLSLSPNDVIQAFGLAMHHISSKNMDLNPKGFQCSSCGQINIYVLNSLGEYQTPSSCPTRKCNGKTFSPILNNQYTKIIDSQMILVQDKNDNDKLSNTKNEIESWQLEINQSSRNFHTLHCQLKMNLVDQCLPGDMVILSGVFSCFMSNGNYFNQDSISTQKGTVYTLYLEVNNLIRYSNKLFGQPGSDSQVNKENNANLNSQRVISLVSSKKKEKVEILSSPSQDHMDEPSKSDLDFTMRDLYTIRELYLRPNIFDLLVSSFCPSITGRAKIKAGILLTLLGGTSKNENKSSFDRIGIKEDTSCKSRNQSHLLLMGDPGLGKSQLLKAALAIAPRGIYVCGNTCSTAGLTIGLSRTDQSSSNTTSNAFGIEAGAVVLADQGVCFIDEFDKLACNSQCLLEAMEQQSVSISKGGVVVTLPARTSLIVAANPINGKYDTSKTLHDNLKISHALISRFDLVFLLSDEMNSDKDRLMTSQMLANADKTLSESIIMNQSLQFQREGIISASKIKKYILYARKYVNPILSQEAADLLKAHYLEMRQKRSKSDLPVTFRYLESLIRLSESRAKAELRQEVTEGDAKFVCDLVSESFHLNDAAQSSSGLLSSVNKICGNQRKGISATGNAAAKRLLVGLQAFSSRMNQSIIKISEMRDIAKSIGLNIGSDWNLQVLVERLGQNGFLISKGNSEYKLL